MNLASYKAGNNFKTFVFVAALTGLLLAIGYLVGGASGLIVFAAIAVVFNFAMYWFSGPLALKMSRAVPVSPQEQPELHQMIARLAERAGVPNPAVYMTPAEQPNAFATGRNPKHAAIAVTAGIQRALGPRELEGVLAHEMAHIANRDILIASIAAMVAGAISAIANFLQFSLLFGGDDENPLGLIGTLATIILAPIAAVIIQLAISRQREYVADATGAEYVGDPNPLADALETLHRTASAIPMRVNPAAEPLYIVNPLQAYAHSRGGAGIFAKLFSTHPPMEERVARLRRMAGASSLQLQRF
ncbi:MAG TPA: zinc metalloprotease HtpX [Miltoncostaeaceae bacterium]|jgi:heat shock protein HtpX|nr:zinc metalloprotease HtpX [Miltoncostaeaceae bacterium]